MYLEVFKLNPHACRIVPADVTLCGEIRPAALKYCGPFTHASGAGFWVYPSVDVDIAYRNGKWVVQQHSEYGNDEVTAMEEAAAKFGSRAIRRRNGVSRVGRYHLEKTKLNFGQVGPDVWQLWTGCIFRMPPGWGLWVTDPININTQQPFRVQNGILEVDWLRVDHWLNFKWTRPAEVAKVRKDQQYPIAQLIPIPRESYDQKRWELRERRIIEDETVFREWDEYYYDKFVRLQPRKDSSTYHKTRKRKGA